MRAVVADGFGEAWALREVPDPTPGPRNLLVQVEASGICYTDVQQLENPAYSGAFPVSRDTSPSERSSRSEAM